MADRDPVDAITTAIDALTPLHETIMYGVDASVLRTMRANHRQIVARLCDVIKEETGANGPDEIQARLFIMISGVLAHLTIIRDKTNPANVPGKTIH